MELLNELKRLFEEASVDNPEMVDELVKLYDEDMVFRDPIQTIRGREGYAEMNRKLLKRSKSLNFTILDSIGDDTRLYLTWKMTLQPRMGPEVEIEGVTRCLVEEGKIVEHVDYWDLAGAFLGNVPGVGKVYREIVSKLG